MKKLRSSKKRGKFAELAYLQLQAGLGKTIYNDEKTRKMHEFYKGIEEEKKLKENDIEWQKNNLEYDLRTSKFIYDKCKNNDYAKQLYAALCNNDFMKNDVWPILRGDIWTCSWRYAGGIIADIREEGDYIDWYCSGNESIVSDEIRSDLLTLGWIVLPEENNEQ